MRPRFSKARSCSGVSRPKFEVFDLACVRVGHARDLEPDDDGGQGHPCRAGEKEPAPAQGSVRLSGASAHPARSLVPLARLIPPLYSTTDSQTLRRPLRGSNLWINFAHASVMYR